MNKVNIKFNADTGKYSFTLNGKSYNTRRRSYIEYIYEQVTGEKRTYEQLIDGVIAATESVNNKFCINERFGFVQKLVKMVASGVQASAVITGQGGLGKSHTVMKTLEQEGYMDISELASFETGTVLNLSKCYTVVKGYSTAKGLYRTLFENNNSVIIFDDCDSILSDSTALNILKGALDSYSKRVISWNADMRDEDLPRSFEFTGKVIFISNLDQDKIDQAIRSRSMMIDLSMTTDQKIDRMEFIASQDEFMPEFDSIHKMDALECIRELKETVKEVSLRSLIQITKIRATGGDDWKKMAEYVLCA